MKIHTSEDCRKLFALAIVCENCSSSFAKCSLTFSLTVSVIRLSWALSCFVAIKKRKELIKKANNIA